MQSNVSNRPDGFPDNFKVLITYLQKMQANLTNIIGTIHIKFQLDVETCLERIMV